MNSDWRAHGQRARALSERMEQRIPDSVSNMFHIKCMLAPVESWRPCDRAVIDAGGAAIEALSDRLLLTSHFDNKLLLRAICTSKIASLPGTVIPVELETAEVIGPKLHSRFLLASIPAIGGADRHRTEEALAALEPRYAEVAFDYVLIEKRSRPMPLA